MRIKTKIAVFRFRCKFLLLLSLLVQPFAGKGKTDAYTAYVEKYAPLAVEHRERFGIPAAVTLAQGLLESAAGRSTLATKGNNHFGIKCHKEWTGDTLLRDDDAAQECFRAYASAEESFMDHSRFLCRGRYRPLHEIAPEDYAGWAHGLKKCGYATDPNYAERLIAIIERYALYTYDTDGETAGDAAEFIFETLRKSHAVRKNRGLHYVIAAPGDTYSSIAREFSIPLERLLAYNDAEKDAPVRDWEEVYLEEKLEEAPKNLRRITVGEYDTLHSISQKLGMKQSSLERLNAGRDIESGASLRLH